jgi:hypothetical protein
MPFVNSKWYASAPLEKKYYKAQGADTNMHYIILDCISFVRSAKGATNQCGGGGVFITFL